MYKKIVKSIVGFLVISSLIFVILYVFNGIMARLTDEDIIRDVTDGVTLVVPVKDIENGYLIDSDSGVIWSVMRVKEDPKCMPCHSNPPPDERINLSDLECPYKRRNEEELETEESE
jgi:hypothetical protein